MLPGIFVGVFQNEYMYCIGQIPAYSRRRVRVPGPQWMYDQYYSRQHHLPHSGLDATHRSPLMSTTQQSPWTPTLAPNRLPLLSIMDLSNWRLSNIHDLLPANDTFVLIPFLFSLCNPEAVVAALLKGLKRVSGGEKSKMVYKGAKEVARLTEGKMWVSFGWC